MAVREINKEQCKVEYPTVYNCIFLGIDTAKGKSQSVETIYYDGKVVNTNNDRKPKESLHDYFNRKGLKCFCPQCKGGPKMEQGNLL